eukprot:2014763-Prymnesium_polylepis.1
MEAVQQAAAAVQAETDQDAAAITERLEGATRQKLALLQVRGARGCAPAGGCAPRNTTPHRLSAEPRLDHLGRCQA